jgi:hypothetical protein
MSMMFAWQRAVDDGCEWAVVFEDDAEPPEGLDLDLYTLPAKYPGSKVIYMDSRNATGDGVRPGCCHSGMMYHRDVLGLLLKEFDWDTSHVMNNYDECASQGVVHDSTCLNDWLLANILKYYDVRTSSHAVVKSGKFDSQVS